MGSSRLPGRSSRRASSSVIRMRIDESRITSARVSGARTLPGRSNYFIGNEPSKWRHEHSAVRARRVSRSLSRCRSGLLRHQGQLEYDFRVAPAADPSQIALSFQRSFSPHRLGSFRRPPAYRPATEMFASTRLGFIKKMAAQKNRSLEVSANLPTTRSGSQSAPTIIAANSSSTQSSPTPPTSVVRGTESFVNVTVDTSGLIYLVGSTTPATDFPFPPLGGTTIAPFQGQPQPGPQNVFIAVINPFAQPPNPQLLYATYLGGSGNDFPAGIAVEYQHRPADHRDRFDRCRFDDIHRLPHRRRAHGFSGGTCRRSPGYARFCNPIKPRLERHDLAILDLPRRDQLCRQRHRYRHWPRNRRSERCVCHWDHHFDERIEQ